MKVILPSCSIPKPRKAEFFSSGEMHFAFVCEVWFHSQTHQTSQKSSYTIANSEQSQGKLFLLGRNISRDGMGRLYYYNSGDEAQGRAQDNHYPNRRKKVVPRLKQKKQQVSHFQNWNSNNREVNSWIY